MKQSDLSTNQRHINKDCSSNAVNKTPQNVSSELKGQSGQENLPSTSNNTPTTAKSSNKTSTGVPSNSNDFEHYLNSGPESSNGFNHPPAVYPSNGINGHSGNVPYSSAFPTNTGNSNSSTLTAPPHYFSPILNHSQTFFRPLMTTQPPLYSPIMSGHGSQQPGYNISHGSSNPSNKTN